MCVYISVYFLCRYILITLVRRVSLLLVLCGRPPGQHAGQETIYDIFQECLQLAVERADTGVSNPRDLWGAPALALRFTGAIGLIPGLDWRESGEPHI